MNGDARTLRGEASERGERVPDDLRREAAGAILEGRDVIAGDTAALFSCTDVDVLESEYCHRLAHLLIDLLYHAVGDGQVDARSSLVAELCRLVAARSVSTTRLFTLVHLGERTALDELAQNPSLGATCEPWPHVAQLVRRGSFDMLAAYTERLRLDPFEAIVTDPLTTLYTRPLLLAVLAKEMERASRGGAQISLILFGVDRLAEINSAHGTGVGNRILERIGILCRTFFRQQDWIARHADDSIAVLLPQTGADDAADLADRWRTMVEARLTVTDHWTSEPVSVTVTAAVIGAQISPGTLVDPDGLLADAEAALARARTDGRNRVLRVNGAPVSRALPRSSPSA